MPTPVAVLFRTHFWDDFVERVYRRLKAATKHDVYVCFDVSRNTPPDHVPVLPHSVAAAAELGLVIDPKQKSLWYNGDYALYLSALQIPTYDYYAMIEFDVAVAFDFDALIERVTADRIDFTAAFIDKYGEQWRWSETVRGLYERVTGCIFPFVVLSSRASTALLQERLRLSELRRAGKLERWPFCEAFVSSFIASTPGFSHLSLERVLVTDRFTTRTAYEENRILGEIADGPPREEIIHPVLDGAKYVDKRLQKLKWQETFSDALAPGSPLYEDFSHIPRELVAERVIAFLGRENRHRHLRLFKERLAELSAAGDGATPEARTARATTP